MKQRPTDEIMSDVIKTFGAKGAIEILSIIDNIKNEAWNQAIEAAAKLAQWSDVATSIRALKKPTP